MAKCVLLPDIICLSEIIKLGKVEEETQVSRMTQSGQDMFEMHVRAANMVRHGPSQIRAVASIVTRGQKLGR